MENANPSSPLESPNSPRDSMICELDVLLESLNLTASPLERNLKGDVKFVELFKENEIRDFSDEEVEEGEIVEKRGTKLIGIQLLQLELRLAKTLSRSFRPLKLAETFWQIWRSCSLRVPLAHDRS
ncbi:hypothetical protein Tco_1109250 [Tanacetum coccineum]